MSARLLFVIRRGPYEDSLAREAIDALLGSAALGTQVLALFTGDGVLQWLPGQAPSKSLKNVGAMLKALPLYDIEDVYIDGDALQRRGIDPTSLPPSVTVLDADHVRQLLSRPGQMLVSF